MITCDVPFPVHKSKAIVFTFDDGLIQDRRLVALMNRYHIKGTFFLNSGTLGKVATWITPPAEYLRSDEIKNLFEGHEVGGHTVSHPDLTQMEESEAWDEINNDKLALEALLGRKILTFGYPFGLGNQDVAALLGRAGYRVGRLINQGPPKAIVGTDPLLLVPSAHFNQAPGFLEDFLRPDNPSRVLVFWGHSWELDRDSHWGAIEDLFKTVAEHPEVWTAGLSEVFP